jgi:putative transcription factor
VRCEVCGRKIHSDPIRAVIEGAKLTVCVECSKHGKVIYDEPTAPKTPLAAAIAASKAKKPVSMMQKKKQLVAKVEITQELVEGYPTKIRVAREKLGLSHEDLGLKISERASVLKHIELGKMEPNNLLSNKLERTLKIKLLVPIEEEKPGDSPKAIAKDQEMTLGDLIEFKDNDSEEPKERKQS